MDENRLFSIIVPVFNRQNKLNHTLSSLAAQSYRPLEIVLVDNASTDDSLSICMYFKEKHQGSDLSVQVLSEPKPGANAARNTGFRASKGDYLLFFDSDDLLYSDSLSIIFSHIYRHGFPEAVAFPFILRFPDGKTSRRPHRYSSDPASQLFDTVIATHNICIKRSLMEKTSLWDENLSRWQDLEFGFRLLLNIKNLFWIKGSPLYEVSVHDDSISGKTFSSDHYSLGKALEKIQNIIELLPEGNKKDHIQRGLSFKFCSLASQIKLENNSDLSHKYLDEAISKLPANRNRFSRSILRFHYYYSGNGGRGFWRAAEKLL
jgi:glycosyltransferase involved in cell wall biosynthesis